LPEANSNYPKGYKVLSFYVDPETLLQKSYVLRKDSWQDPDCSYQRMLVSKKIRAMRKYLHETKRVYVNNLIVTLPSTTTFFSPLTKKQLDGDELRENQYVEIHLPEEFNSIGLIDGQHRVYSYHEGTDSHELSISRFRKHQNLLVTAIMYPDGATDLEKTKFEATLFLEINDEQTRAGGDLKQAIELFVRPFTTTAISKAIILELAKHGPLKGLLEEHYFDEDTKIKTSSIVSYGLKPLVKFGGNDSLMSIWTHPDKINLAKGTDKVLLKAYIDFCVDEINKLLIAFKINAGNDLWLRENKETCVLSPTSINGFIVCLRELIKNNLVGDMENYQSNLTDINKFDFKSYRSSHWKQLGLTIFSEYFKDKP
jgi:DGQHR domain-containing protein